MALVPRMRSTMRDLQIIPFDYSLLVQAGELLAMRHIRDRTAHPLLPSSFEEASLAEKALAAYCYRPNTRGVAAVHGSSLLGYLIGELVISPVWGRSAWIRPPGYALAPGQDIEALRHLYAALAEQWVHMGVFFHFAQVAAGDVPVVDAFFRLSFGLEQVHALADLDRLDLSAAEQPVGVTIRRSEIDDRETLADMSPIIWQHYAQAPVWGIHLPEEELEHRLEYASLVADPEAIVWLAFYRGEPAGMQCYFPVEYAADHMYAPPDCIELAVGCTKAGYRGLGIGQALTRRGLAHARESGYHRCLVDWRSTSPYSSFWTEQGFQPILYRLVRRVDNRIAWGK